MARDFPPRTKSASRARSLRGASLAPGSGGAASLRRRQPRSDIDEQIASVSAAAVEARNRCPSTYRGVSQRRPSLAPAHSIPRARSPSAAHATPADPDPSQRSDDDSHIDWDYDLRRGRASYPAEATGSFETHTAMSAAFFSLSNMQLAYQSLGVVFGDVGTSPLYAISALGILPRTGENGTQREFTPEDALESVSIVFWLLLIVALGKYVIFVLAADFHGEGGTFALVSMLRAVPSLPSWFRASLLPLGLLGSAMVVADGAITPAISVLSAMEGLRLINDGLDPYVVPVSIAILVGLFAMQPFGTYRVSFAFSPIMVTWFLALAALGVYNIIRQPRALIALSPHMAIRVFERPPTEFLTTISTVMLSVTGVEALYADLGHFGRKAITTSTCALVLPSLVLAYLGQAAVLQEHPEKVDDSFYLMVPNMLRIPMVVLAALATIAASQALITAAFSICKQAVAVDCFPRVRIIHTSEKVSGQVYVPVMNLMLFVIGLALVGGFQSSAKLGALYGVAVAFLMFMTVMLMFPVCRSIWKWNYFFTILVCGIFGVVHLLLLVACFTKFVDGAWIPFCFSIALATIMGCWLAGRRAVRRASNEAEPPLPLEALAPMLTDGSVVRAVGSDSVAVFLVRSCDTIPIAFRRLATKHIRTVAEQIVILEVAHVAVPFVPPQHRLVVRPVWTPPGRDSPAVVAVRMFVGYVELPELDLHSYVCARLTRWVGAVPDAHPTYFLEDEHLIRDPEASFIHRAWVSIFIFLSQNCPSLNSYDLPYSDTMATAVPLVI